MNIRPFTDALRAAHGRTAFIQIFDSVAGGPGRIVRFAALFGGVSREADCRRELAVQGDRWVEIDISDQPGAQRASHFVVTADCIVDAQGPQRMRASTLPTSFRTPDDMLDAIQHEITRNDHPRPEYNRAAA